MAAKKPTLTTPEQQEAEARLQEPEIDITAAAQAAAETVAPVMQPVEDPNGRVYAIFNIANGQTRLVFAATQAQAMRHVAKDSFTVSIPTTRKALEFAASGVAVEVA